MKNYLKFALSVVFAFILSHSLACAQFYSEKGYITSVKANNEGTICFLRVSKTYSGAILQRGYWRCSGNDGKNILNIAKYALINSFPVLVIFEKKGEESDPVRAVELFNLLH